MPLSLLFFLIPSPKTSPYHLKEAAVEEVELEVMEDVPSELGESLASSEKDTISAFEETSDEKPSEQEDVLSVKEESAKLVSWTYLGFCGLSIFLYVGAEVGYGGWIYSYAVDLGWASPDVADYLSSTFWASLSIGRVAAIPLTMKLSTTSLLVLDLVGCTFSMSLMGGVQLGISFLGWPIICGQVSMWIVTILIGLSMASFYPSLVQLPAELGMKVTGGMNGWIVLCAALGELILPLVLSYTFELVTPQTLPIVVVICILLNALSFICMMRSAGVPITKWFHLKTSRPAEDVPSNLEESEATEEAGEEDWEREFTLSQTTSLKNRSPLQLTSLESEE